MSDEIKSVGVLGAGQMGRGIAEVAAQSGYPVLLADIDLPTAQSGRSAISKGLEKSVAKGKIDEATKDSIVGLIEPVGSIEQLSGVDIAIEAVTEREELKTKLFIQLDAVLGPKAILATNTSSISITRLALATARPSQVVGMHFMNPVPRMKLVEVICGLQTNADTTQKTVAMAEKMNKLVVTSKDYPGFIVNRILMPMINEAVFALMEGVASVEDIDLAMKFGTNHPMGPLALADLIGLDTCLAIMDVLHQGFGDSKYRPCPLLRSMVDAKQYGRKSGQGFYTY
jgi:3-hydroxybutyryl-CoA dehydrogenase